MTRGLGSLRLQRVLCLACLALLGCAAQRDRAVIGYAFAASEQPTIRAAEEELAAGDTSRSPAISIVLESQGGASDPADVEVQRAQRLASVPGIVGVVGHGGSRASLVAAPVYNRAGIVQVVPTGTSRQLHAAGPWTFMLAPDDSVEGAFIGTFLAERLAARRVSVFFVRDEYGFGLRDGLVAELRRRGLDVVDQVAFQYNNNLRTLVSASFHRAIPDAVVVAGRQGETGCIARFVHEAAPRVRIVAGDGALVLPTLADSAGPAADSIYAVAFWLQDARDSLSQAFVERFRRLVGRAPESYEAMAHDAIMVLAAAIRAVGPRPGAMRTYLGQLGVSRPPFHGVTGPIGFGAGHAPHIVMARLHAGTAIRVPDR